VPVISFPEGAALKELYLGSEDLAGHGLAVLTGCSHGKTQHVHHSKHGLGGLMVGHIYSSPILE